MRSITIHFVLRQPDEAIAAAWLDPAGEAWVEVGDLRVEGIERRTSRRVIPPLLDLVRACAGSRRVVLVCRAGHGRLYQRFGARVLRSGLRIRSEHDCMMELFCEPGSEDTEVTDGSHVSAAGRDQAVREEPPDQ